VGKPARQDVFLHVKGYEPVDIWYRLRRGPLRVEDPLVDAELGDGADKMSVVGGARPLVLSCGTERLLTSGICCSHWPAL
jgi:hypothetical protein